MKIEKSALFLLIPITALLMRFASGTTANISFGLIALYALKGREQALQALFLSWLFSSLNFYIAPDASAAALGRYGVLLAAAISVLIPRRTAPRSRSDKELIIVTSLFGSLTILHSLFFSSWVDVSLLKAISWTLTMMTLLAGWSGLNDRQRPQLTYQLFGGLMMVMLASLALVPFPAGYMFEKGFMGILGQSQAFGITMALLGAWAAMRAVAEPRPSWALISMLPACMGLILLSGTRTAAVALLLGVAAAILLGPLLTGQPGGQVLPGLRSRRVHLALFIALVCMAVAWPKVVEQSTSFIEKNAGTQNLAQAYQLSRGFLIDAMWLNIESDPWQGIGFGIASIPDLMEVQRDPIFDLPISAPVEKGVLPVAVLEELGIPGFVLFVAWLWIILKRCARRGVPALAVFLVALLLNMGEAILFSSSGMGMLAMLLIAWAATGKPMKARRA